MTIREARSFLDAQEDTEDRACFVAVFDRSDLERAGIRKELLDDGGAVRRMLGGLTGSIQEMFGDRKFQDSFIKLVKKYSDRAEKCRSRCQTR